MFEYETHYYNAMLMLKFSHFASFYYLGFFGGHGGYHGTEMCSQALHMSDSQVLVGYWIMLSSVSRDSAENRKPFT